MKSFVIDASYVLAFLLKDEYTKKVDDIFLSFQEDKIGLVSTELLDFEVCNALIDAKIRKRVSRAEMGTLVEKFENLHIEKRKGDNRQIMDVAIDSNLTFYDAVYLALARELGFPLLSMDRHLKKYLQKI